MEMALSKVSSLGRSLKDCNQNYFPEGESIHVALDKSLYLPHFFHSTPSEGLGQGLRSSGALGPMAPTQSITPLLSHW